LAPVSSPRFFVVDEKRALMCISRCRFVEIHDLSMSPLTHADLLFGPRA
jgi:hypothetical protein